MSAPFVMARDPVEARELKRTLGFSARYMAGGTALQLAWPDGQRPHPVIDILALDMGPAIAVRDGHLRIAANARLEDVRTDARVRAHAHSITTCIGDIASLAVRHLATFGGNIAWRAGDLVPLLCVLGATVELAGREPVPLASTLASLGDEILLAVNIPLPLPPTILCEKIGRRAAFSPSVITVAAACGPGSDRDPGMRMAVGGGPVEPAVLDPGLVRALAYVADFEVAAGLLAGGIVAPDDDVASGRYRAQAAGRVLADFVLASRAMERNVHVPV